MLEQSRIKFIGLLPAIMRHHAGKALLLLLPASGFQQAVPAHALILHGSVTGAAARHQPVGTIHLKADPIVPLHQIQLFPSAAQWK